MNDPSYIDMEQEERSLVDYLEDVKDKETFLNFIRALIEDRQDSIEKEKIHPSSPFGPDVNGWENITVERFFEAALAWATDSGQLSEEPSWYNFAQFIYCGKIYE